MKKVLFMAFACLMMVMTACSGSGSGAGADGASSDTGGNTPQGKANKFISLSKEYKAALNQNDEAKMQEILAQGSRINKEMEEMAKKMSPAQARQFQQEFSSKMNNYDVAYFIVAIDAYDEHTTITSFEKIGNEYQFMLGNRHGGSIRMN